MVYTQRVLGLVSGTRVYPARKTGGISFMWPFKKKVNTPLENLIHEYGKDLPDLLEFARCVGKPKIEDICLEDIKAYYKAAVEPIESRFLREEQ